MPRKIDPDSNPTRKALGLYGLLLFSGSSFSLTYLSSKFKCSKQTISRWLEQIELSGETKLESIIEDGEKWYKIRTPPKRPNVSLTSDDLQRLVLCRDMLCNLLPQSYKDEINKTLSHATVLLYDQDQKSSALQTISQCAVKGGIDYTPFQDLLSRLAVSINNRAVCQIKYQAPRHTNPKTYHFAPIRLIAFRETLYVRGLEVQPKGSVDVIRVMTFPLHRFHDVQPTRRILPKNAENGYKTELDDTNTFGIINNSHFEVEVRFTTPTAAKYVGERTWSPDQVITPNEDGTCILRFTAQSEIEVVKWVLGFGADAELIAPENLRQKVIDEHAKALERYRRT